MARKPNVLQGIPSDSAYDYMMPALSSKDIGRDKLVSYTSTKIYNNRPKTFDLTKILEGYTLTGLEEINDNASMIAVWPSKTQQGNNTIKLKAARVRIPLIHDGFLPDPLNQDDVNKFGLETIKNLHPLAYLEVNNNGGGISGFFGIASEPGAFTRAKIQIKDANLTRFEILSFLNKMTDPPPQDTKASNASGPATPGSRKLSGGRAKDADNCEVSGNPENAAKVVRGLRLSELYHIVQDFYDPLETSLPIVSQDPKVGSPACKRIDPIAAKKGEIKFQEGGHKGVDIPVDIGNPVLATAPGQVIISKESDSAGNYVTLIHEPKNYQDLPLNKKESMKLLYTRYLHLDSRNVVVGQKVQAGDVIGRSGNTGERTTGPHLHYETRIFFDVRLAANKNKDFDNGASVLSPFVDPDYKGASSQSVEGKFSEGYAEAYKGDYDSGYAGNMSYMTRSNTRDRGVPF